jgi:hypothetical protein
LLVGMFSAEGVPPIYSVRLGRMRLSGDVCMYEKRKGFPRARIPCVV